MLGTTKTLDKIAEELCEEIQKSEVVPVKTLTLPHRCESALVFLKEGEERLLINLILCLILCPSGLNFKEARIVSLKFLAAKDDEEEQEHVKSNFKLLNQIGSDLFQDFDTEYEQNSDHDEDSQRRRLLRHTASNLIEIKPASGLGELKMRIAVSER